MVVFHSCVHLSTSSDLVIWACGNVVSTWTCLVGGLFFDASKCSLGLLVGHLQLLWCVKWLILKTIHFLAKLPHLACWKLLQINIRINYGFGDKLLILRRKTRIYLYARYLQFLVGTWQETWVWTAFYHSLTDMFPCLELVSRSNLVLTSLVCGLQNLHIWTI